jgi:uncharacterized protein YceK
MIEKFNKHRLQIASMMLLSFVMLFLLSGCSKENVEKSLKMAGSTGTYYGLKKWSEKKPEAAKETAAALSRNVRTVLIPYLDGGKLPISSEVQEFINSSLFKDVSAEVKEAVVLASVALDAVVPVPSAEKLKDEHVLFIKAFLTGVADGCDKFLGKSGDIKTNWLK